MGTARDECSRQLLKQTSAPLRGFAVRSQTSTGPITDWKSMNTLVHIGWPKTGTTWLQDKVFIKELGYVQPFSRQDVIRELVLPDQLTFDAEDLRKRWGPRLRESPEGFVPVISHERLCGVLQNRLESVVFGERIVSALRDSKILIVVREQRAAMLAAWQQYVRNGGTPESGPAVRRLGDYFGDETSRRSVLPPPGDFRYFEYHRLVDWYVRQVGPSRVLVLPLELLPRSPNDFHWRVRNFSGAHSASLPNRLPSNEAWAPMSYTIKRWLNYVGDRSHYPKERRSRYQFVMSATHKFDTLLPSSARKLGATSMRSSVETMAGRHFVESNRRLGEMVPWDPEEFGYMT
jgi:hypothetical protein